MNGSKSSLKSSESSPTGAVHWDIWTVQPNGVIDIVGASSDGGGSLKDFTLEARPDYAIDKVTLFPRYCGRKILLAGEKCWGDSKGWKRGVGGQVFDSGGHADTETTRSTSYFR